MRHLLFVVLFFYLAAVGSATTYYVRTDGSNSNAGTSNTAGGAWLTITKAATSVTVAGDVVRVQAGNYNETVSPTRNGSSGAGNTITFVADGTVNVNRLAFSGNSYLRFIGLNFNPSAAGGSTSGSIVTVAGTNTGLELWNNTIANSTSGSGIDTASGAKFNSSIIVGNTIHDTSNDTGIKLFGDNNLVACNTVYNVYYIGILLAGSNNRVLNNYFYGLIALGAHPDFFYGSGESQGITNLLWEGNLHIGTPTSADNKWFHFQNQSGHQWLNNVFRRNVSYNIGSGLYSIYSTNNAAANAAVTGSRFYNNTHTYSDRAHTGDSSYSNFGVMVGSNATSYVFNDIYFQTWAEAATTVFAWVQGDSATLTADYNLAAPATGTVTFDTQWTSQAHKVSNQDPLLVNVGTDFRLASTSSPAYHAGGPITTASGSGTGTTFNVATNGGAMFFGDNSGNLSQYGGGLVPGDTITVGTDVVTVVSISGDAITVSPSFTWANGDPVYYGDSVTPEIGAYPYGVTALTSASISNVSTTYTVTPIGSCRGVMFYVDGIPNTWDGTSPYTATIASGVVTAQAYPLYAQTTPVVSATLVSGSGSSFAGKLILTGKLTGQ